ncbi:TonB-dependent receptor [Asticcacaulis benevestitus]|nr:TonB-dependent receptor [Asticcacaulis benevestitus]
MRKFLSRVLCVVALGITLAAPSANAVDAATSLRVLSQGEGTLHRSDPTEQFVVHSERALHAQDVAPAAPEQPAAGIDKAEDGPAIVVTVRKPSITNKIDRRVYDVSARDDAFSNANDVLSRIPSVTVDPRGRIALRGNRQVKVLIDGVEGRPEVVSNLRASEIDRIEVMTNPSGQFASDGSGGIINIILKKKRKQGINGDVSLGADGDERYNFSGNVSYKTGRWTASAGAGSNHIRDLRTLNGLQQWSTPSGIETTTSANLTSFSRRFGFETARLVYDASINDRLELGFGNYHWRGSVDDSGIVQITGPSGAVVEDQKETIFTADNGFSAVWTFSYVHKGKVDGERFSLKLNRVDGRTADIADHHLSRTVPSPEDENYSYSNLSPTSSTSLGGDYERPFGTSRLTAGFWVETSDNDVRSRSENIAAIVPSESDFDTTFLYDRRTLAGYGTWQTPLARWVVMPGLRIESEQWNAGASSRDELRLLPSLSLNRPLSDTMRLVASYSKRTQRPDIIQLNPRRVYYSRYLVYEGNSDLRAQNTDSFEVGYEFTGKKFSSNGSLYYRVSHDPLTDARRVAADQTVIATVINADKSRAAGLELSAKGKITKTADYSVNLNVFDSEVNGVFGGETLRRQYVTWSGNAIVEFKPTHEDWLQLNLNGAGRSVMLQGYQTGFYRLDLAYRRKLTAKLTIAVNAMDLLNSSKQTTLFVTPEGESRTIGRAKRLAVMIGLTRKFGNSEQ